MANQLVAEPIPEHALRLYLRARATALEKQHAWASALRMYPERSHATIPARGKACYWRAQLEFAQWKQDWNQQDSLRRTFSRLADACRENNTTIADMKRQALQLERSERPLNPTGSGRFLGE